jgi:hypothetical protein
MNGEATVEDKLARLNPVPKRQPAPHALKLDDRALHDLNKILASPLGLSATPRRTGFRWTWAAAVAAAVTIGITCAVVSHLGDGAVAYAATPEPLHYIPIAGTSSPTQLLDDIASRVAQRPNDIGSSAVANVHVKEWNLGTRVEGRLVESSVVAKEVNKWVRTDGAGRVVTSYSDANLTGAGSDQSFGPGQLGLQWPLGSLSSEPQPLKEQLAIGHPVENGPAERLMAIKDAYLEMPLPPSTRAAVLRYLAATPGLRIDGEVSDRLGRPGLAFSVDSDFSGLPTRYTAILDQASGRLLDFEEELTTRAGKLNVPVPSIIGYTVFLESKYVNSTR